MRMISWSAVAFLLVFGSMALFAGSVLSVLGVPVGYCVTFPLAGFLFMQGLAIFYGLSKMDEDDSTKDKSG